MLIFLELFPLNFFSSLCYTSKRGSTRSTRGGGQQVLREGSLTPGLKRKMSGPPPPAGAVVSNESDICNIVISYLLHNCYKETAEAFITATNLKQPANYQADMDKRKSILNLVLEGNSLEAIELTKQLANDLLEENKDLHFQLLSLHFVDMVRSKKCSEALEFAQTMLTPFGKMAKYVEKLEDFMALLAYEEPEKSPMFHLLSQEYRESVANNLNRTILAHLNLPCYSSLERLIQQITVVQQCLSKDFGKDGPPFSLKTFLNG